MPHEEIKERARTSWGMGEYAGLSEILRPAAHALADACAVSAGQEVLDVAAGDGNFALACAAEGASVVACDLAPGMVERGRRRSAEEGYEIEWVEADAESLPFEDGRFDCVGSVFGAMIAPDPRAAAEQLFRVARPGNTVGMTAWTPQSAATEMFRIGRKYAQAQPGVPAIEEWGVEESVHERFAGLANTIEFRRGSLQWPVESPERFVDGMELQAPMQAAAKAAMEPELYARLRGEMVDWVRGLTGDGPGAIEAEYMLIVARRRG